MMHTFLARRLSGLLLAFVPFAATLSQPSPSPSSPSASASSPSAFTVGDGSAVASSFPYAATESQPSWSQLLHDWTTTEDIDLSEETFDLLADLSEHKLDLNHATREDLEQFPFLSAIQVEELVAYLDRYKPMRTLNELLMLPSLDWDTRRLLICFVFVAPSASTVGDGLAVASPGSASSFPYAATVSQLLPRLLADGHHTFQATVKVPFYKRKGDRTAYRGYPNRHDIRYQFSYRNQLKFGLTAAQDAGEPFFANRNRWGYDFYTYYFQLRNMGRLEELNLGMYRVQLGMGLVMNTGFHLGKLAMLQSQGRTTHVLTAHASRSSASYQQGAAATWRLAPHWRLTAFASYRPLDATLNDDGTVRTVVTDGYHRTATELSKKNNTHLADLGLRLAWRATVHKGLASISANALYSRFDRPLLPTTTASTVGGGSAVASGSAPTTASPPSSLYRRYALSGNNFLNASLDYSFTNYRLSFSGETALNRQGALATLHSLSYRLTDQCTLLLLHRYYDKRYTAYHAHAFSEGSSTQNEHGLYLGTTWTPSRTLLVKTYVDYVRFPSARYQVSMPSDAFDAMLLARTLLYNKATFEARYRFHLRQRDNEAKTLLQNRYEHRTRLRLTIPLLSPSASTVGGGSAVASSGSLTLITQADGALVNNRTTRSRGIMLSQQAQWKHRWLQLNAILTWFHTDDYDSRLYQYEPSVRYDFSFPLYYGHGLHYALMARADHRRFSLIAKIGTTDYFDRAVISSGQQQIDHSSMTDLLLQLRYRF